MMWLAQSPITEASFWQHPAVIGVLVGLPSLALGLLVYQRSRDVDEVAEQAGIATAQRESIGQVVDGLNRIIGNLQIDNEFLRKEVAAGRADIAAIQKLTSELRTRVYELEGEIRRRNNINDQGGK
jgi:hypothetical protein